MVSHASRFSRSGSELRDDARRRTNPQSVADGDRGHHSAAESGEMLPTDVFQNLTVAGPTIRRYVRSEEKFRSRIPESPKEIHGPAQTPERHCEALRRFLPARNGECPIRIELDFAAGLGWRRAMTRANVRHLSLLRAGLAAPGTGAVARKVVAGAVAAEAGQPDAPGWELGEGLPTWERELIAEALEAEASLVGAGTSPWE
jgi:hypothetical protein